MLNQKNYIIGKVDVGIQFGEANLSDDGIRVALPRVIVCEHISYTINK